MGHLVAEAVLVQITWGLAGLLRTSDYKLSEMRTPSGEVKAGKLHIIYVLKTCDYYMNNKLGNGGGVGWDQSGSKSKLKATIVDQARDDSGLQR